jgi:hypothetical protein
VSCSIGSFIVVNLMSDFTLWLQNLGLAKYGAVLAGHDIDLTEAPDLTEQGLEKLGLSLGHRPNS